MTEQKPEWIKVKALSNESYSNISSVTAVYNIHTVCQEALCPNINECWASRTATFLLMGDVCTRSCRFCSVKSGNPMQKLDLDEPYKIAKAVNELHLKYAVLTSVDRDDLPDGGAGHFANTIKAIKEINKNIIIEALIPDFSGNIQNLEKIIQSEPDVIGHNIETVRRLSSKIRDRKANYDISLFILKSIKEINPKIFTKSSIQLGFGETDSEIKETIIDLRNNNVNILTIGQYLRPGKNQTEVKEYIHPEKFDEYKSFFEELGFMYVASSPFVRSSYKAGEYFLYSRIKNVTKDIYRF